MEISARIYASHRMNTHPQQTPTRFVSGQQRVSKVSARIPRGARARRDHVEGTTSAVSRGTRRADGEEEEGKDVESMFAEAWHDDALSASSTQKNSTTTDAARLVVEVDCIVGALRLSLSLRVCISLSAWCVCVCVCVCVCLDFRQKNTLSLHTPTHSFSLSLSCIHTLSLSQLHTHTLSLSQSHSHTHTHTHTYTISLSLKYTTRHGARTRANTCTSTHIPYVHRTLTPFTRTYPPFVVCCVVLCVRE
jgi:hypothetical protein